LGEDSSTDDTATMAMEMLDSLDGEFRRAKFYHLTELDGKYNDSFKATHEKHAEVRQMERRSHLASARNLLLSRGLEDEDWVVWLDSDIQRAPRDLLQRMLRTNKTIIAPHCVIKYKYTLYSYHWYDLNTWRETKASLAYQALKKPTYLFLEGYNQPRPRRTYLAELYKEGDVVSVDGVGTCALLVKADHHRRGLNFPAVVYSNQIESEGLARMAKDMGISVWGMPRLAVLHTCNFESAHWYCA
jgi:glycosyltransferase involved in cell wall biosynthesis